MLLIGSVSFFLFLDEVRSESFNSFPLFFRPSEELSFLLFDSGFRPEDLNIGLGVTVRIRDIKSGFRTLCVVKNFRVIGITPRTLKTISLNDS
jgi:hypothetical protein